MGDAVPRRAGLLARRRRRLAGDEDPFAPVVGERVVERQPGALHAGNAGQPALQVAVERGEPLAGDRGRRPADGDQHAPVAIEAEVLALEVAEAAAEHRRAGHQHHRAASPARTSSALRANEARSPAVRPEPRSASIGSVRVANHAGAAPKSSPVSSARPVAKASTSGDGVVSIGRMVAPEKASDSSSRAAAIATISPASAPPIDEHHAFDQRLGDDLPPRGAHGQPHRGLAAPRHRPGEQQVGDVGTGDQQHQRAHRQQDAQAAAVLLLHHADAGAGRHHGDHLLRQHALDLRPASWAGSRPRAASIGAGCR